MDVQVARRASTGPSRTTAGQAQRRSVVDPGGHGDGAAIGQPAVAVAIGARGGDGLAHTLAPAAGDGGHHLAQDLLADPPLLAGALAVGAPDCCSARPGSRSAARVASDGLLDAQITLSPEHSLLELELEHDLGVGAAHGTTASSLAPTTSEEGVEYV